MTELRSTPTWNPDTEEWEPNLGGGGGGSMTPPVTLTGTDGSQHILKLVYPADQTALAFRIEDSEGNLLADFDELGKFDVSSFNVQDPPDVGGPDGVVSTQPGRIVVADNGTDDPFAAQDQSEGGKTYLRVRAAGHGDLFELSPSLDTDVSMQLVQSPASSVNQIELWDNQFNNVLFAVTKGGGVVFPAADPHVAGAWWDNAGTLTRSAG